MPSADARVRTPLDAAAGAPLIPRTGMSCVPVVMARKLRSPG